MTRFIRQSLKIILFNAVIFLAAELGLRALGFPRGIFNYTRVGEAGHYPNNSNLEITGIAGQKYHVKANSFGFRSGEISFKKPAGTLRIAALGDSFTDGFFVENEFIYPIQLEKILRNRGLKVEVINLAWGGASIDKESALFKTYGLPLKPDIVLLGFYPNDLFDIRDKTPEQLLHYKWDRLEQKSLKRRTAEWFIQYSALGDALWEFAIWLRSPRVRQYAHDRARTSLNATKNPTPQFFKDNLEAFRKTSEGEQPAVSRFHSPETQKWLANYMTVLDHFLELCRENTVKPVFIYIPAYSQIYDPAASKEINTYFAGALQERKVSFLDLTDVFQEKAKNKIMHFAPVDFHFNEAGYQLMAEAIGSFLETEQFIKPRES